MAVSVFLACMNGYESSLLDQTVFNLLDATGFIPEKGWHVLVKPNLVNSANAAVSCTNPLVVRAVCRWLIDRGVKVIVADSPAFGPAAQVARASGLQMALKDMGLTVRGLGNAATTKLPCGISIGISRMALEADAIVNVPRLKAHCQMRVTAAVKNLFGCVSGARKALAHNRFGSSPQRFIAMLTELCELLPHKATLLDAVVPMHETGPVKGSPFHLGMLAASTSAVAVDTAAYTMLDLTPKDIPLWQECRRRRMPGADNGDIRYGMNRPEDFDVSDMILPESLDPLRFEPFRLLAGRIRSMKRHFSRR